MINPFGVTSIRETPEFAEELIKQNFLRSRRLALVLFFLNFYFIFTDILNYQSGLWNWQVPSGYLTLFQLHALLGLTMALFIIFSWLKLSGSISTFRKRRSLIGLLFPFFGMFFSTCVSINDQRIHSEITVVLVTSFLIAVNNYLKPKLCLTIYATSWFLFILGITHYQTDMDILKGHYINGTILMIFSVLLSQTLYKMKLQDFMSQETIHQKNKEVEEYNRELIEINNRLKDSLQALDESQNVIFTLASALESKDTYTRGHSERVANYALQISQTLGLSVREQQTVWQAAQLHDIGKIGIPDAILNKPGILNKEEKEIMRTHPEIGGNICSTLSFARDFLPLIRHHHEHFDGTGYPDGLKGEEIPFLARIITIADAVDAITSQRSYRPGRTIDYALEELAKGKGSQFDPMIAQVFIDSFNYA